MSLSSITAYAVEPAHDLPGDTLRADDPLFDDRSGLTWTDRSWARPWELEVGTPVVVERDEVSSSDVALELFGERPTSISYGPWYYLEDDEYATCRCHFADGSTREMRRIDVDARKRPVRHDSIVCRKRYLGYVEDAYPLSGMLPAGPVHKDALVPLMRPLCFDSYGDEVSRGEKIPDGWDEDCDGYIGSPNALAGLVRIWFRATDDDLIILVDD